MTLSHVLTLREYDRATIGEQWDPARRIVPPRAVGEIERLQASQRAEIFALGHRVIVAQQFVGTIGLGDRAIDLLPKVDQDDGATRSRLAQMLAVAGLVPGLESGLTGLARGAPTLVDAFMALYVTQLAFEWRRGRIASYRREAADRLCLRGKLLFEQQLRRNLRRPDRFFTDADEFVEDVPLSRLLKAALRLCRDHAVAEKTRRSANELLAEFEHVRDADLTGSDLATLSVDRRTARFGPLVNLAKVLLGRTTPDRPGDRHTYSLVFDMNEVFERYIGQLMRLAANDRPLSVRLQVGDQFLLYRGRAGRFRLRPDIAIYDRRGLVALVDTKWKRLDMHRAHDGVSQADMYQMYAYGKEYACPLVILLYPHGAGLPRHVATYRHRPGEVGCPRIEVWTVDVSQPPRGRHGTVMAQLRSLLDECIDGSHAA